MKNCLIIVLMAVIGGLIIGLLFSVVMRGAQDTALFKNVEQGVEDMKQMAKDASPATGQENKKENGPASADPPKADTDGQPKDNSASPNEVDSIDIPEAIYMGGGVLWADRNLAAPQKEEAGHYFLRDGSEHDGSEDINVDQRVLQLRKITPEYDPAAKLLGRGWRLPTKAEFQELAKNSRIIFSKQNGIPGILFESKIRWGGSVFFPFRGHRSELAITEHRQEYGRFWLADGQGENCVILSRDGVKFAECPPTVGLTVRPVMDKANQAAKNISIRRKK